MALFELLLPEVKCSIATVSEIGESGNDTSIASTAEPTCTSSAASDADAITKTDCTEEVSKDLNESVSDPIDGTLEHCSVKDGPADPVKTNELCEVVKTRSTKY